MIVLVVSASSPKLTARNTASSKLSVLKKHPNAASNESTQYPVPRISVSVLAIKDPLANSINFGCDGMKLISSINSPFLLTAFRREMRQSFSAWFAHTFLARGNGLAADPGSRWSHCKKIGSHRRGVQQESNHERLKNQGVFLTNRFGY